MNVFLGIVIVLLVILGLYTLSVMGRRGHPGLQALQGWSYAHRGLHGAGCPENSMAAFRRALQKGYGVELDIHLLADGNLAVIHDASLKRTAGAEVLIEDLRTEELQNYYLENTLETIPEFSQVLDLFEGKAPIIVELKSERGNYAALVDTAVKQLKDYSGPYCIESFDPRCILYLKKQYPEIVRGQLAENFLSGKGKVPWIIKLLLTLQLGNFLLQPDFVAYKFVDRKNLGNFLVRKLWRVQGVAWTLKNRQDLETAKKEGWLPIFEGFEP